MPEGEPRSTRRRTAELRSAWRGRTSRRSPADTAYLVYLVAITGLLLVAPAVAVVLDALRTPVVLATLDPGAAPRTAVLLTGLGWAAAVWTGPTYGPVTLDPALLGLWAGTDVPRRVGLRRFFWQRAAWPALAGAAVAALAGAVPDAAGATVLALAGTGAAAGVVASVAWLLGQALPRHAWWLGLAIIALTLAASAWAPVRLLALGAVLAPLAVPRLLDTLRGPELLSQALRWQSATTTARSGDLHSALASLQALPRRGRRWRALVPGPAPVRLAVADLVAAARTTGRAVTGTLALTLGALATGLAGEPSSAPVLAAAGALVAYLGLGVLCDGLRDAAALAAQPALLGHGRWQLFALRGVAPAAGTVLAGASVGGFLVITGRAGPSSVVALALVLATVLVVRVWGATKGPLPVALLAPAPSPVGDLSGVSVAMWLADAPLLVLLAGGGTAWLLATDRTGDAVVVVGLLLAALLASMRRRVARL